MTQMAAALALIAYLIILDALAKPATNGGRRVSSLRGLAVLAVSAAFLVGCLLALTGSWLAAFALTILWGSIVTLGSGPIKSLALAAMA